MHREFEHVMMKNEGRIRYIAARYSHDNEFDDIYQEILLQLWRSFDSYQGQASRETWLYKVALNTACSYVRKEMRQKDIKLTQLSKPLMISQPAQNSHEADILNGFMDQLNDIDASILMMYLDGLSSEASAEVVGISATAVRSRVKRIKNQFEQQYIGES